MPAAAGADDTATFALNVESNAAQIAAEGAEGLANLQERMQGSVAELRNMNASLRNLKGAAGVSGEAVNDLKNKITAQRAALAAQNAAYLKSGGTFKELAAQQKTQAAQAAAVVKAENDANKLRNAQEKQYAILQKQSYRREVLKQNKQLVESVKGQKAATHDAIAKDILLAEGYIAVAKAASEAALAVGRAVVGLFQYGVAAADARRSELLQLEGFTKIRYGLFGMMGGYRMAADSAGFLQTQLDAVSENSAVGRDVLAGFEQQLYRTGLRAGNLQEALGGMAIVSSTQGEAQAQRFASMAAGARYAGVSVKRLADDVKARLGGIAEAQMLSLDVQTRKLHESFAKLFGGLKIDPLLRGLREVTALFSLNTAQGFAMKQLLEAMFQPMIDDAPTAGLIVKKVITGMLIGAEVLYGKYLDLRLAWAEIFGSSKALSNIALAHDACMVAAIGVGALAGAVTIAALSTAALIAPFALAAAAGWELGKAIFAIDRTLDKWGTSSAKIGLNFVLGLAGGITGGTGALVAAVISLADVALDTFHKKFDMHSPSRVMHRDGQNIVRGQIGGIREERPALEREVRNSMVRPVLSVSAEAGVSAGAGRGAVGASSPRREGGSAGTGHTFTFGNVIVNGTTPAEIESSLRNALERLLGGTLVLAGGTV